MATGSCKQSVTHNDWFSTLGKVTTPGHDDRELQFHLKKHIWDTNFIHCMPITQRGSPRGLTWQDMVMTLYCPLAGRACWLLMRQKFCHKYFEFRKKKPSSSSRLFSVSSQGGSFFLQTFLAEEKVTFVLRGDSANILNPWYDVDYCMHSLHSLHSLHCVKIDNFWLH